MTAEPPDYFSIREDFLEIKYALRCMTDHYICTAVHIMMSFTVHNELEWFQQCLR